MTPESKPEERLEALAKMLRGWHTCDRRDGAHSPFPPTPVASREDVR